MTSPLMSRDEVAALLGIKPNSVRDTLRRYGITEQRGYPREAVENLNRPGRGYRSDLVKAAENLPKMLETGAAEMRRQAEQAGRLMGETLAALHRLSEANKNAGRTDLYGAPPHGEHRGGAPVT